MPKLVKSDLENVILDCTDSRQKIKLEKLVRCVWSYLSDDISIDEIKTVVESLSTKNLIIWDEKSGYIRHSKKKEGFVPLITDVRNKARVWVIGHYTKINPTVLEEYLDKNNFLPGQTVSKFIEKKNECLFVWDYGSVKCHSVWGETEFQVWSSSLDAPSRPFVEYALSQPEYDSMKLQELPQSSCAYLLFNELYKILSMLFQGIEVFLDDFTILEGK